MAFAPPYRYTFETDEQYNARLKELEASQPPTGAETTEAPSDGRSTFDFLLPGWMIAAAVIGLLVVGFFMHRRRMIRERKKMLRMKFEEHLMKSNNDR